MTCIIGLIEGSKVYMGADSAGVSWYDLRIRADQKVFRNGPFLMGFTSSFRMGQLLHYSFSPPTPRVGQDIYEFLATDWIDGVRSCLQQGGYMRKENNVEEGGTFLVGYQGRLFAVYSDFQVAESVKPYESIGCGSGYALGAMYATEGLPPEERIRKALEAAEQFSAGVRGPFVVKSIGEDGKE